MNPYDLGKQAKKFNDSKDTNPYRVTPWAAKEWNRGWDEG